MYLPNDLLKSRILIAVKTYPRPTPSYDEIVCTAGVNENGKWIRIYPIPFRNLPYEQQFPKYSWVELDLVKSTTDTRPESYSPKRMFEEPISISGRLGTEINWSARRKFLLNEVHTSMGDLINLAYGARGTSLATFKPKEMVDFQIEKDTDTWDPKFTERLNQMKLFETRSNQSLIKKLPFRYYYHFLSEGDQRSRKLEIQDWEIGSLFWNCYRHTGGDSVAANELVKKKYWEEFKKRDLFLFLGTTYVHHKKKAPNPFSIVGVFYPPQQIQLQLEI